MHPFPEIYPVITCVDRLPYRRVIAYDGEYRAEEGSSYLHEVHCVVAKDQRSGLTVRRGPGELARPPYEIDDETLFISYSAAAEHAVHIKLGWPLPRHVIDLRLEYLRVRNGESEDTFDRAGDILSALDYYGLPRMDLSHKQHMRNIAIRGGPFTHQEVNDLLDYCEYDVIAAERLFRAMLPSICLPHALIRGRSTLAQARVEQAGLPINAGLLARINGDRLRIIQTLVERHDRHGLFRRDTGTLIVPQFEDFCQHHAIVLPRTRKSGRICTQRDALKEAAELYPELKPIVNLKIITGELRNHRLKPNRDGRSRTWLNPFGTITGRYAPSNSKFLFGLSSAWRHLLRAERGRFLGYLDYGKQEHLVSAAIFEDPEMLRVYYEEDCHLYILKQVGLVAQSATKTTHKEIRDNVGKPVNLGLSYGMGPETLAKRTGLPLWRARDLHRSYHEQYHVFSEKSQRLALQAMAGGLLTTRFGWTLQSDHDTRLTTLGNFLSQGNAAEMTRLAMCMLVEAGVCVLCPVHDAVVIEGPQEEMEQILVQAQEIMRAASRIVLGGYECEVDVACKVTWPGHYVSEKGQDRWQEIMEVLDHG